jgi:hypothetical protein
MFSLLCFQAVDEIHALKEALYKEEGRVRGLVDQVNKMSSRLEDVFDENSKLRRAAGLSDTDKVDIKDVRMQKEAQITQLRSLNALLERQVGRETDKTNLILTTHSISHSWISFMLLMAVMQLFVGRKARFMLGLQVSIHRGAVRSSFVCRPSISGC